MVNFVGKRAKVRPELLKTLILCGFPLCRNYTVWANKNPCNVDLSAVTGVFIFSLYQAVTGKGSLDMYNFRR